MCQVVDKTEYLSEMVANNAVELHKLSAPAAPPSPPTRAATAPTTGISAMTGSPPKRAPKPAPARQNPFYVPFRRRMHRRKIA